MREDIGVGATFLLMNIPVRDDSKSDSSIPEREDFHRICFKFLLFLPYGNVSRSNETEDSFDR